MAGKQILLVDDHPDTLEILSRLLKLLGYSVTTAASVAEARQAATDPFDLLISDLTLPDGNGADLAREICASRNIPAIALSGYNPGDSADPKGEANFVAHLVKPIDFQTLQTTVGKVLPQ